MRITMSEQPKNDDSFLEAPGSELIIGLVGAVGTNLGRVFDILRDYLKRLGYQSRPIHLIESIHQISGIKTQLVDTPL